MGVLAVAGYQNRDKIAEVLKGLRNPTQPNGDTAPGGSIGDVFGGLTGGGLGGLGDLFRGGAAGGSVYGGLGDLLKQFEQEGQGETAKSWIEQGQNKEIGEDQLSEVLGPEILDDLAAKTGLSREEIVGRLSRDLPEAVDDMTPHGQIPSDDPDEDQGGTRLV